MNVDWPGRGGPRERGDLEATPHRIATLEASLPSASNLTNLTTDRKNIDETRAMAAKGVVGFRKQLVQDPTILVGGRTKRG
jgi:hypothetical protein